jgi:hypothetical protein
MYVFLREFKSAAKADLHFNFQSYYNFFKMFGRIFGLAAIASSAAAAATSGDFNVLALNVAGLPAILNDNSVSGDKATNAGTIGKLFAQYDYDVINVQEGQESLNPGLTP